MFSTVYTPKPNVEHSPQENSPSTKNPAAIRQFHLENCPLDDSRFHNENKTSQVAVSLN